MPNRQSSVKTLKKLTNNKTVMKNKDVEILDIKSLYISW